MMERNIIINEARSWLGTPYHHQASLKGVGCDCLGLVRGVWKFLYGDEKILNIPMDYSHNWMESLGKELLLDAANEYLKKEDIKNRDLGNVLIFRMGKNTVAKHTGIITSENSFIHAHENTGVVEVYLDKWWENRIVGVFSFIDFG